MTTLAATPTEVAKFHFSLHVADLKRTVAFYRVLFGTEPAKDYPDYAKFELDRPPVVLSFLRQPASRGASLNHVGLRLPDSAGLVEMQRRLEQAGYSTLREEGVECCYALQTKFWVTDPDGVQWEVYTLHQDIGHHGMGRPPAPARVAAAVEPVPANGTWTHSTGEPFPDPLPFDDAALNEVHLLGTFNAPLEPAEIDRRLSEARRALRPGGRVRFRGLVGDRPYPGVPDFPGLLARIKHIPVVHDPIDAIARAGFVAVHVEELKPVGCIEETRGVSFQALTVSGTAPAVPATDGGSVRYDGPFTGAMDDDGTSYPRGVTVQVSAAARDRLRAGPAATQFTFLDS